MMTQTLVPTQRINDGAYYGTEFHLPKGDPNVLTRSIFDPDQTGRNGSASGQYDVLVGRIRQDLSHPHGLALFVAGDQLLKGAAWNAVQILECLVGRN